MSRDDLHNKDRSSNVRQLVILKSLNVVLLHQSIDILLDVGDLGRESTSDLVDDFFDKVNMLELLATLHDSHDDGLGRVSMKRKQGENPKDVPEATAFDPPR